MCASISLWRITIWSVLSGKESFMRLNEKALDDFVRALSTTSPMAISTFMNALSAKWKGQRRI